MIGYFVIFSIIRINLPLKLNRLFYINLLIFNIVFFLIYIVERFYIENNIITFATFLGLFFIFLDIYITSIILYTEKHNNINLIEEPKLELLPQREKELILLEEHLNKFNVIGLNGEWGSGKSFLMQKLKEKLEDKYEYIEIDLLTSNLNEVSVFLIETIEKKLLENGILPRYTNNLKRNLSSVKLFGKFQDLISITLNSSDLKSGVFKNFVKETKKIQNKKLLIIFEDIDRIENKEVMKEIFSISEKFSGDNIKIIYQYDENILLEKEFTFQYLEKYIPFKMYLTPIDMREIVDFLIDNRYQKFNRTIVKSDFDFLHILYQSRFNILTKFLGSKIEIDFRFKNLSFRKIENMISETTYRIEKHKDILKYKETIITFFVVKHFLPEQFRMIWNSHEVNLFDIFIFRDKAYNEYTILDLINSNEDKYQELFFDNNNSFKDDNSINYFILKLFNYKLINVAEVSDEQRFKHLKKIESNNHKKQNRIIKKLIYEGKSQLTDEEFLKEKFVEIVLNSDKDKSVEYKRFLEYMYNLKTYQTDNRTVFLLGEDNIESLFKAYNASYSSSEEYFDLLEFYFEHINKEKILDINLIKSLNKVSIDSVDSLIKFMDIFSNLDNKSNFNNQSEFYSLIEKVIVEIFGMGVVESSYNVNYYELTNLNSENLESFKSSLEELKNDLEESIIKMNQLALSSLIETLNITLRFVEKVLIIINTKTNFKEDEKKFVTTTFKTEFLNQKTINEIVDMKDQISNQEILLRINDNFRNNCLTITEASMLVDMLKLNE